MLVSESLDVNMLLLGFSDDLCLTYVHRFAQYSARAINSTDIVDIK